MGYVRCHAVCTHVWFMDWTERVNNDVTGGHRLTPVIG